MSDLAFFALPAASWMLVGVAPALEAAARIHIGVAARRVPNQAVTPASGE